MPGSSFNSGCLPLGGARVVGEDRRPRRARRRDRPGPERPMLHARADERAVDAGVAIRRRCLPDDGVAHPRPRVTRTSATRIGIGADDARRSRRGSPDREEGTFQRRAVLDHAHPGGSSRRRSRAPERDGEAPAQDVAVHLQVLLGRADVDPVAAWTWRHDLVTAAQQLGEERALDRVVDARRHQRRAWRSRARRCRR